MSFEWLEMSAFEFEFSGGRNEKNAGNFDFE
jgi:hypothetical protein